MIEAASPSALDLDDADVLVVGFGIAGACAAISAAEAGARVLVVERTSAPGGSSALSGGELYLGGGTSVQKECGFEDTPDDMFAFLRAALGPHADEEKLRAYCDGSAEHFRWLVDHGVDFQPSLYEAPTWMPPTTDGLMWLGENSWPFDTLATPAPRGHRPPAPFFAGKVLMDALVAAAREAGVRTVVDTRVKGLVVEDGRVVGVRAKQYGDERVLLAARGVVLTTGGFVDNEEMLADHAPMLLGRTKVSDGLDDGSGILMAQAVGAATRRMDAYEVALTFLPALAARGILVDALGQRFVNEDTYPGTASHAAVAHRQSPYWVVADETCFEEVPEGDLWGVRPTHVAENLAELEQDLGMPAGSLEATVTAYNHFAAQGEDPHFHKAPRWLRPLQAPFAAVDVAAGFNPGGRDSAAVGDGVAGFTLGGLRTDVDGAVQSLAGTAIPGLWAAGRVTSSIHGDGYISGTSLGDGSFFGRRAGRSAAAAHPPPDPTPLEEPMSRLVVVTGAASGIGAAVVALLRSRGDRVIGVDLKDAEVCADLSTPEGRAAAVAEVLEQSGGTVDGVVTCAGLSVPSPALPLVNYFGTTELVAGLREALAASAAPRVVLIGSISGTQPVDRALVDALLADDEPLAVSLAEAAMADGRPQQLYPSSKSAIAQWARRTAVSPGWADAGIPVNVIAPGVVLTPMSAALVADPAMKKVMDAAVPMPLHGYSEPEDLARAVCMFLSPELTHVTGQVLYVDGGAEVTLRGPLPPQTPDALEA